MTQLHNHGIPGYVEIYKRLTTKDMRKIVVLSMISLDGVMQAPGAPKEDPSGGFRYGGWTYPYGDEVYGKAVTKELHQPADYLLGRKTFELWEGYWPRHAAFWPAINTGKKYVLSRKRKKSDWNNSAFIRTVADIKKLRKSKGPAIQVWGSSELVQVLLSNDLVDELRLKIHPLTLGKGKRLFTTGAIATAFSLRESSVTTTGVILANYVRAGKVKTGTVGKKNEKNSHR